MTTSSTGSVPTTAPSASRTPGSAPAHPSRRWWVLVIVGLAQLVVVLDGTIVNIALPQAQAELGLTDENRQWVVTAYALAFGALLLLGGRIADFWGRKRTFIVGMVGFGAASAFGGLVSTGELLVTARALQGVFAALLAPAALAVLTTTFDRGRERNTAFAVFGAISGAGAAVGLVLGGVLTEFVSWRWCLLVNVPIVIVAIVAAALVVRESKAEGDNRLDVAGTVVVALGLASLVYGFTQAEDGWGSAVVIGFIALGAGLLALFVLIQKRSDHPLLPLGVLTDRVRGGAFLVQLIVGSVMIGALLYLTFHLQIVLGFGPLEAGLATLPMTLVIMVMAPILTKLLPVIGPRVLMIVGPVIAAAGLFWLSLVTVDGAYATHVLPPLIVMGVGLAGVFVPMQNLALAGVAPHEAGAASATSNAMMQIGGSVGLAVYTNLYASAVAGSAAVGLGSLVEGYSAAFVAAGVATLVAAVISFVMIRGSKEDLLPSGPVVHMG
ncbi:MFS transporter [Frigoribacterium endophyticum]|uniref:MFS transporter n=1 Tax=Frigoribacterium endophyticum TaxID=1522176 RepID=UPI0031333FC6|nr:EmrB/QacA subfamily drug resistance transporter [Frigoribacterium endophyticum]